MLNGISLTEKLIITPVLHLRVTPLNKPRTLKESVGYFLQSEVVIRVIAAATSLFASVDASVLLGIGIIKGAHLGLRKLGIRCLSPAPSGKEVAHYFKQSGRYLGIALVGSIAATVWPNVLKYFRPCPFSSVITESVATEGVVDWQKTSETVFELWVMATCKRKFEQYWDRANLNERQTFVSLLDRDTSEKARQAKLDLVDIIYKKFTTQPPPTEWPKQKDAPVFYHATTYEGLRGILQSGKVEVRYEKAYKGAFVSTRPLFHQFGEYILVFNRNIERLSPLNHGFPFEGVYWAGFSHDIPVNATTLIKILVSNECDEHIACMETNFKVEVAPNASISGDKDIPKEWPLEKDPNAPAILLTMHTRVEQELDERKARAVRPVVHQT